MVRDLIAVVHREKAAIGVLIGLALPTRVMGGGGGCGAPGPPGGSGGLLVWAVGLVGEWVLVKCLLVSAVYMLKICFSR